MLSHQAYLHLITGGAWSGKSRYAQQLAREWSETSVYVATDLQGWANQYAANQADAVTLMVSGLPMFVKTSPP